jgi:four helix bundle protein
MAMDYRRLEVWKKSMLLVKTVYPLIERLPQEEKYALGNQIRRAVTSIVLNIAE